MLTAMAAVPNDFQTWFDSHEGRLIHKWPHYFEAYDRHFSRFRGQDVVMLEIGVSQGGSIQMWRDYFGPKLQLFAIDIDPRCQMFAEPGVEIFTGSQSDPDFLREVAAQIPDLDILLDDGGHTMRQQHVTMDVLYDKVKDGGVFACEDLVTSYWVDFGGGYRRRGTFIERAKGLVDSLNAFHSEQRTFQPDKYTHSMGSLHFYDSLVFIEKQARTSAPVDEMRGSKSFVNDEPIHIGLAERIRRRGLRELNKGLRSLHIRDITTD